MNMKLSCDISVECKKHWSAGVKRVENKWHDDEFGKLEYNSPYPFPY